ncbi:LLM class flavin-dependent oxidoreductase [bacterium]|nr:LLM class flavin-dependent oxidoreductase [bacterium]
MGIYEEIKYLLAKEKVTLTSISQILQKRSYEKLTLSNLSRKIKKQTIKFEEVREIADILGYNIKFEKKI